MSTKPKTRLVVCLDGIDRLVMSLELGSKGDLCISRPPALNSDYPIGTTTDLRELRYSVHPSRSSKIPSAITITGHIIATDKEYQDWAAFVPLLSVNDAFLFSSVRCLDLAHERYASKSRSRDKILKLGTYGAGDATLIYHLIAARPSSPLKFTSRRYQSVRLDYEYFTIYVLWHFINLPPTPAAYEIANVTSQPRLNGLAAPNHFQIEALPMNVEMIDQLIAINCRRLAQSYLASIVKMYALSGKPVPAETLATAQRFAYLITPRPLVEMTDIGDLSGIEP